MRGEIAAGDQRNTHRLQIAGLDGAKLQARQIALGHRAPFNLKRCADDVFTQRQRENSTRALDAGENAHAIEELLEKGDGLLRFAVARVGEIEIEGHDADWVEAGGLPREVQHAFEQ